MCERKVEKSLDRQFEDPNRIQILKFKNVDSYLYGETQLVYFVEVRKFLRSRAENKSMELVFLSLSMSDMRDGFDPDRTLDSVKPGNRERNYEFPPLLSTNPAAGGFNGPSRKGTKVDGLMGSSRGESLRGVPGFLSKTPSGLSGTSQVQAGGLDRRRTTGRAPGPKTQEEQAASRYKHVSIFGWYTPATYSKEIRQGQKALGARPGIDMPALFSDPEACKPKVSYQQEYKNPSYLRKEQEGNTCFIKAPKTGRGSSFLPYTAETEVLRSCDIFMPLKISLVGVRQLAQILRTQIGSSNPPQKVQMMSFVVPQGKAPNSAVDDLLADCFRLGNRMNMAAKKDMEMQTRNSLTNPYGNRGMNAFFTQGFQSI